MIATQRVSRSRELGLLVDSQVPSPRPDWIKAWEKVTAEQKAARARDMEVCAGMIDYADEQIGRILDYLRETGEFSQWPRLDRYLTASTNGIPIN